MLIRRGRTIDLMVPERITKFADVKRAFLEATARNAKASHEAYKLNRGEISTLVRSHSLAVDLATMVLIGYHA